MLETTQVFNNRRQVESTMDNWLLFPAFKSYQHLFTEHSAYYVGVIASVCRAYAIFTGNFRLICLLQ